MRSESYKLAAKELANQKLALKNQRAIAKYGKQVKVAKAKSGLKNAFEGMSSLASSIITPISARKMAEAKMVKENTKHYQEALNRWMDQMDANPSNPNVEGASGKSGDKSTTETDSIYGG